MSKGGSGVNVTFFLHLPILLVVLFQKVYTFFLIHCEPADLFLDSTTAANGTVLLGVKIIDKIITVSFMKKLTIFHVSVQ